MGVENPQADEAFYLKRHRERVEREDGARAMALKRKMTDPVIVLKARRRASKLGHLERLAEAANNEKRLKMGVNTSCGCCHRRYGGGGGGGGVVVAAIAAVVPASGACFR